MEKKNVFKVGERVKCIERYGETIEVGDTGIIRRVDGDTYCIEWDNLSTGHDIDGLSSNAKRGYNVGEKNIMKIKRGITKITHIVTYDVKGCGDPHIFCYGKDDMRDNVKRLLLKEDTVQESLKVFEIAKQLRQPKIQIRF